MKLTQEQLAELEQHGMVTIQDEAHFHEVGADAALDMLGVALARLDASASRHNPQRCPDCGRALKNSFGGLCDDCAARRHEMDIAA